jgi:hypothetical protein
MAERLNSAKSPKQKKYFEIKTGWRPCTGGQDINPLQVN